MLELLDSKILPGGNREDLDYFLTLQEAAFPNTPQYTPARWDKRADFWEKERKEQRKDDERVTATMEFLEEKGILTPGGSVADIGCGPGRFVAAFAQKAGRVEGFDVSPRMVDHGNAYLQSLGFANARLHCCDFSDLDIEKAGYKNAFDLVFSSMTPAVHNAAGLLKSMEMSRGWCLNISHIRHQNHLQDRIRKEVFGLSPRRRGEGRVFYALFNILYLLGYEPQTSYVSRRKEKRVRPDGEYVEYIMEHTLPLEEHTRENAQKIQVWLLRHAEEDGLLADISDAVYGRILWDVRSCTDRPDYRSLLK